MALLKTDVKIYDIDLRGYDHDLVNAIAQAIGINADVRAFTDDNKQIEHVQIMTEAANDNVKNTQITGLTEDKPERATRILASVVMAAAEGKLHSMTVSSGRSFDPSSLRR